MATLDSTPSKVTASQGVCPLAFTVMCGVSLMRCLIIGSLEHQGFREDSAASLLLILDFPPGFALSVLTSPRTGLCHTVVVTGNTCPEYWTNLDQLGAQIVIVGNYTSYPLAQALHHAVMGARYHLTPAATTPLTPMQRQVLHLLACGCSNQQIAEQTAMRPQSIRNMLTTIYRQIGVADRINAALYYWGLQPHITPRNWPYEPASDKEM